MNKSDISFSEEFTEGDEDKNAAIDFPDFLFLVCLLEHAERMERINSASYYEGKYSDEEYDSDGMQSHSPSLSSISFRKKRQNRIGERVGGLKIFKKAKKVVRRARLLAESKITNFQGTIFQGSNRVIGEIHRQR